MTSSRSLTCHSGPSENTTAGEEKAGEDAKQSSKTGAAGDNSEPADDDANKSARIAEDWYVLVFRGFLFRLLPFHFFFS